MTIRRGRRKPDKEVFWRAYEKRIAALLAALDPDASVKHNETIVGFISGVPRQIDALAEGAIAGQTMRVVAEAKCHSRRVTIEMIDGFVGKLLDLGAERGVFYSASGFTDGAVRRASKQRNPQIGLERIDATPPPDFSDAVAYSLPNRIPRTPRESNMRREHVVRHYFEVPVSLGAPVVKTYEEFLRGEGFLYIED
ncbi:restriction endonuclease [Streptomyces echinatus]|uniref:restriction endonuclease n=1 Tax=Streptomyces echinatus TaxID=67293 RepID=UPI0037F450FF